MNDINPLVTTDVARTTQILLSRESLARTGGADVDDITSLLTY